ncbi:MAG TPA: hypothetical protein VGS23_09490 [Thermoplasmata archaeon]|nr:hypothetical protein [Thermoplasmata archaeon]
MGEVGSGGFRTPYTPYPGGSIPPAEMPPEEGRSELWAFFWLAFANTAIIVVAGLVAWFLVAR